MSANVIGKPQDRVDGKLKVTGAAMYPGDRQLERLAHGFLLTSTVARGSIRSMETASAENAPGVIGIFTPFNPLKLYGGLERFEGGTSGEMFPPLQDKKILNYGQIIGIIVAESFEQARDAAPLVKVEYDTEAPIVSWETGLKNAISPENVDNQAATVSILADGIASIDDAINRSQIIVEAIYTEPILHHNPMEPHATVAVWEEDRLTIYDTTQGVVAHRNNVAAVLGVDQDNVRVICPFVGGAFGCKGSMWMFSPLTAAAARILNRPVKTILTREQMFTLVGHRPALIQRLVLGTTRDGQLQAVKHDVHSTVSFAKPFVEAAAHRTSRFLYKSPNIQVSQTLVPFNVGGPTFMRAPGNAPGMFALECAIDELSATLGIDPIELRRNATEWALRSLDGPLGGRNLEPRSTESG
jgi:xanthine dehydrogenase YagR molybdenum-binding subunit